MQPPNWVSIHFSISSQQFLQEQIIFFTDKWWRRLATNHNIQYIYIYICGQVSIVEMIWSYKRLLCHHSRMAERNCEPVACRRGHAVPDTLTGVRTAQVHLLCSVEATCWSKWAVCCVSTNLKKSFTVVKAWGRVSIRMRVDLTSLLSRVSRGGPIITWTESNADHSNQTLMQNSRDY